MITFVTGKPGDGKSLYATAEILRVLVEGEHYVVTNIPLVPAAVAAFVTKARERAKDDRPFNFDDGCRVLSDAETYEFYRRRSGGLVLSASPDFDCDPKERLDRPEFVAKMKQEFLKIKAGIEQGQARPVWYFIDEAHNFFSAREWASAGRGMLYYTSQHRHLHDQIWFVTQVTENVEKQLRGLASELHRVRNNLRRSIGPFRLRPCFKVAKFYGVPNENAVQAKPFTVETMFLDPAGVAGCYRTVGALGVQSKPEKITNKAPLPWWTLWVAGGGVVALIAAAFLGLPTLGAAFAKKAIIGGGEAVVGIAPAPLASTIQPSAPAPVVSPSARPAPAPAPAPAESLYVRGYVATSGGRVNVVLSDGRVLTEDSGDLARIGRAHVDLADGRRLYVRAARANIAPDAAR